jgi:hypothetical protein
MIKSIQTIGKHFDLTVVQGKERGEIMTAIITAKLS